MEWATAIVGIVGVLGTFAGTVVTQRIQAANTTKQIEAADKRWSREASERHSDKTREAVAGVLSLRSRIWHVAADSLATLTVLHQETRSDSERKIVFSDEQTDRLEALLEASDDVEHAVARVRLLTRDSIAIACLDEVLNAVVEVVEAARRVPDGDLAVVTNHSTANRRLTRAFRDLRDSAAGLYARPE